ncbi:hypothetical protein BYT27DRAFT_7239051 [Phlegmacium glaucopus]|nr:hypothetical protein BYT27DRAFT_7239051 [Phlegmacium glaucopus]
MPTTNEPLQLAARFLNSHRFGFYSFVSIIAVVAVITNALKNYSNFYSVTIFLSKSSRSILALANFTVLLSLLCGHIVQRIFFGPLRPNEIERLYDRLWFFITESLLAFTIFRDEFDMPFALMFGFLLFVKSFHWLASDRIEWMDQRPYPGPPLLFHFRMSTLFTILWWTDCLMFLFAVERTLSSGVGGMVLFASEYGILMASVMNTIAKYLLSAYDLRRAGRRGGENAPPWENKSMWVFYIELTTDFLKLTTYLIFFVIIITFYGLPLNIVRDVYITARSFLTRLRALHRYQTATRNMDQRYPSATGGELMAMSDRTCIICREEMVLHGVQDPPTHPDGPNTTPKKLPCGHIFHFYCLRSWLERQQSCPTCRRNVLDNVNPATPAAGGPPVPLAGGARQANPGLPADGQNVQGPLGFINRFFGPAARVRNAGQGRQAQQGPNNAQGQAMGQPPGIFINYQVQYQFPRQPGQQAQQQPPQLLHPIPTFPGFPGPGGVWQPWPAAEAPVNPVQAVPESRASNPLPTPTLPHELHNSIASSPSSSSSSSSSPSEIPRSETTLPTPSTEEGSLPTPRDAAALAALNRLRGKNKSAEPTGSSSQMGSTQSTSADSSQPESSNPSVTTAQAVPPYLIPLYDYRSSPSPFVAPLQRETAPLQAVRTSSRYPAQRRVQDFSSHSTATPLQTQQQRSSVLPQLPPNLTDEQLANLDRLTRESIDERLRVLEGVSGAVYRCIDDLMRLRSAIPPTTMDAIPPESVHLPYSSTSKPEPPSTSETEIKDPITRRGKEKMQESVDIESTAVASTSTSTKDDPSSQSLETDI